MPRPRRAIPSVPLTVRLGTDVRELMDDYIAQVSGGKIHFGAIQQFIEAAATEHIRAAQMAGVFSPRTSQAAASAYARCGAGIEVLAKSEAFRAAVAVYNTGKSRRPRGDKG